MDLARGPQNSEEALKVSLLPIKLNKIIIVVGTTGTGKSTIINMLYNNDFTKEACKKPCKTGSTADSITKQPKWLLNNNDGKVYGDTVGLSDPGFTDEEIAMELKEFIQVIKSGVHCIIIVAKFGRFTREERTNLKIITEIFDHHWVKSCVMVLTHYEGGTNDESEQKEIQNWLGTDEELNKFASMIGNNIILTDNSLGRHEASNQPVREQCLRKLNNFIDSCVKLISPAPQDFTDTLKLILEQWFSFYRIRNAVKRVNNVIRYLRSNSVKAGICHKCCNAIELSNMAQINCLHSFHVNCITEAVRKRGDPCPVCHQAVHTIYVLFHSLILNISDGNVPILKKS